MRRLPVRVLLLAALLAAPGSSAAAGHDVSGNLILDEPAIYAGTVRASAGAGSGFNLSTADEQTPDVVRWAAVRGHVVEVAHTGTSLGPGYHHRSAPENRSFAWGAGEAEIRCLPGCSVLLYARPGGALNLEGRVAGPLADEGSPRMFFAYSPQPSPNNFVFAIPPSGLLAGGPGWQDFAASAHGALGLFVENATVVLRTPEGEERHDLSRTREEVRQGPLATPIEVIRNRFLVLEMEGASWSGPDVAPTLLAPAAELHLEGELVAPRATGTLRTGGETIEFASERVLLVGAFEVSWSPGEPAPLLDEPTPALVLDGSATRLRVGSAERMSSPLAEDVGKGLTLAVVLLGVLALLGRIPWAPLYTRLDRASVLASPRRARILAALRADPGLTATALAREITVARAVVLHHLAMLEAHGFVAKRRVGWATRHYLSEAAPDPTTLAARDILVDPTRRRVAEAVAAGARTQGDVMAATGLPQRLVSYHLARLERHDLLVVLEGRPRRYAASRALAVALAPSAR